MPTSRPPRDLPQDFARHGVILFDGICNLCNYMVIFVIHRDRSGYFKFASLQGEAGQSLISRHFPDPAKRPDSIVLIEHGQVYIHSDAVFRIVRRLGPGWALLSLLTIVPRSVRDLVYRQIARRRYRLFGRRDQCLVPSPSIRSRFLDSFP